MTVTVLAGGVGAARMLAGITAVVPADHVTAVVNVGDDGPLHGLMVCPDLDTIAYTLTGLVNPETGWGLREEGWRAMESLRAIATCADRTDIGWFSLGDRDLGTHLWRTTRLAEGARLTEITAEISQALGLAVRLLPVSDDPVRTRLHTVDGRRLEFQEYFVRERHSVPVRSVEFEGAGAARPTPEVLEAIESADALVVAPSNPVVSIGPLLAVPGVTEAVTRRREVTVAVSPIIGGAALKGPADRLLRELGEESSVVGVARMYAPFCSTLVIDEVDADAADAVAAEGLRPIVCPTVMSNPEASAALARATLAAVGVGS